MFSRILLDLHPDIDQIRATVPLEQLVCGTGPANLLRDSFFRDEPDCGSPIGRDEDGRLRRGEILDREAAGLQAAVEASLTICLETLVFRESGRCSSACIHRMLGRAMGYESSRGTRYSPLELTHSGGM